MLNTFTYCNGCGDVLITEDVDLVVTPEGTIHENPGCKGFTRSDLTNKNFGAINAETLAQGLYQLYHDEVGMKQGWEFLAAERTDDVVKQFRVLALVLCSMAEHSAHQHGIGGTYYE